jgi:hypothetical protein
MKSHLKLLYKQDSSAALSSNSYPSLRSISAMAYCTKESSENPGSMLSRGIRGRFGTVAIHLTGTAMLVTDCGRVAHPVEKIADINNKAMSFI